MRSSVNGEVLRGLGSFLGLPGARCRLTTVAAAALAGGKQVNRGGVLGPWEQAERVAHTGLQLAPA